MIPWIRAWTQLSALAVIGVSLLAGLVAIASLVRALVAPFFGGSLDGGAIALALGAWLVCDLFFAAAYAVMRDDQKATEGD